MHALLNLHVMGAPYQLACCPADQTKALWTTILLRSVRVQLGRSDMAAGGVAGRAGQCESAVSESRCSGSGKSPTSD